MEQIIYSKLTELSKVAEAIIKHSDSNLICLEGEMGVGKTTLVKQILKILKAKDVGSSPTFSLIQIYYNQADELLAFHIDCYRIQSEEEALDIGIEEYLDTDKWVFVEWSERIKNLLPTNRTQVSIDLAESGDRIVKICNICE